MYTQLVVKHFEHSVQSAVRLPVPCHLRGLLAAILILHNPSHPRHFLNGCYFILQDTDSCPLNSSNHDGKLDGNLTLPLEESLLSLVRCPEQRWHLLQTWSTPLFSSYVPFIIPSRFLEWPHEPDVTYATSDPALVTEGPSLVMSMKPNLAQKTYAALQCYITQLSSNSWLIDGGDYFCSKYPAKSSLVKHETTLAWVCASTAEPVGYIQYISLDDEQDESQVLITGLAVDESHRRRGYGRALVYAVICRMWACKEIWVAVHEENHAASSLYVKAGFEMRKRHWDLSLRTVIPAT